MRALLLFLAMLPCIPCVAAPSLLGSTDVRFERQGDPAWISLQGEISVSVLYGSGQWKAVDQWSAGKNLQLGYDPALGTILRDPESGLALSVVGVAGHEHPISLAARECMGKDLSMSSMKECTGTAADLWNAQLNLNYQRLLSVLNDKQKAEMRATQRAWLLWRDAQFKANGATRPKDAGSIFGLILLSQHEAIVREQAERLGELANLVIGANIN
jgi:uncharacterized protein YecT (DUF1311 family)